MSEEAKNTENQEDIFEEVSEAFNQENEKAENSDSYKSTTTFAELYKDKDIKQEFIVPELLPANAVAILVGEDGIGKTQIAIQLCLSIALGQNNFLLQKLILKHKRALFCATEDSKEKFTKSVVKQAMAMKPELSPEEVKLDFTEGSNFNDFDTLMKELEAQNEKHSYDLIVIDALSDLFSLIDGEINSNSHARKILQHTQNFCNKYQTTIIIIHHVSKGKIVEKRKLNKTFIEKNDTQGASAITQKPRTVLGLSHYKESQRNFAGKYTNFLHVLKANAMGKQFERNAMELSFDGKTLVHTYQNLVDIDLFENSDGTQDPNDKSHAIVKDTQVAITYEEHVIRCKNVFKDYPDGLLRSDLVRFLKDAYSVGANKIEQANGILPTLQKEGIIIKEGMNYKLSPMIAGEDAPF